jgi:hypothetical protein
LSSISVPGAIELNILTIDIEILSASWRWLSAFWESWTTRASSRPWLSGGIIKIQRRRWRRIIWSTRWIVFV